MQEVEQRELCCTRRKPETQRPSDDGRVRLARKCQLAAVVVKLQLYQSVNCLTAWCFAFEAVYDDGDDDDGDKLV